MANSAHDEIKIVEEDVARLKREIISLGPENAQDMLAIIDLLMQWQLAREASSMIMTRRSVFLSCSHNKQDTPAKDDSIDMMLELHSLEIDEVGWSEYLPVLPRELPSLPISRADINALTRGLSRDITFSDRTLQVQENLSFAAFASLLETYQVGRPSTYSSIFENLISSQLIQMDIGSIRLTELGLSAIEKLSRVMPNNCKAISLNYATSMEAIANGNVSFEQGLMEMLAPWCGVGEVNIDDVFFSLDDIRFDELFD